MEVGAGCGARRLRSSSAPVLEYIEYALLRCSLRLAGGLPRLRAGDRERTVFVRGVWWLVLVACGGPTQVQQPASDEAPLAALAKRKAEVEAEEARDLAELARLNGTCDEASYDFRRPACRSFVPSYFVRGEPAIDFVCPRDAPDPANRACQGRMPCPTPPDRRVFACLRAVAQVWPPCDTQHPLLANPRCDGWSPVPGTLAAYHRRADGHYELDIAPCQNRGVALGWRGHLVDTERGTDVEGTDFTIGAVDGEQCFGVTTAAIDDEVIRRSTRVWMDPP
jgi:hypothetical protein